MSLFNNAGANKPAGGTGSGGGLFSNNAGGASTSGGTGGGLLGNKPTGTGTGTGGGLFQNNSTSTGTGGGTGTGTGTGGTGSSGGLFANQGTGTGTGTSTGGGLLGNKPTGTGTGTGSGGGLFANQGGTGTGSGSLLGNKPTGLLSGSGTGTGTSGGLFSGGSGTGTQQQQQQGQQAKPQELYTTPSDKYLKACQFSNQYLYDLIVDPRPAISRSDFKKILEDKVIREKIFTGLSFYKNRGHERENVLKGIVEGRLKWAGKVPVSQRGLELIDSASEKLNLSIMQTFNLLELYFEFDKPLLDRITYWHPQNPLNVQTNEEIAKLERTIVKQYYKERLTLLDCIYQILIINSSPTPHKFKQDLEKLVSDLLSTKGQFIQNIWSTFTFISEINASEMLQLLTGLQEREEWGLQNLKEQFHILKVLYIIFYELEECSPDFFFTLLEYFHKQGFAGSFFVHERQVTIKSILTQRNQYASMIGDLCVLILLNCLKLDASDLLLGEETAGVEQKNPLVILLKKGKEISAFLSANLNNTILVPIIVAWRRLIRWYLLIADDPNIKNGVKALNTEAFKDDPLEYTSFMLEIKNRPLFQNTEKVSLHFFRDTIKSWVSLLAQEFDFENIIDYEKLVDISCECLKESQNLERFWFLERRHKIGIGYLLSELIKLFPFRSSKLITLITTLLGNKRHNYVIEVLKLFSNLESYSSDLFDIDLDRLKPYHEVSRVREAQEEKNLFITRRRFDDLLINIPEDTPAKQLHSSGANSGIFQFFIKYNFWNVLYKQWYRLLYQISTATDQFTPPKSILKLINLVCKMIIIDSSVTDLLEEQFIPEDNMRGGGSSQNIGVILLLVTTLNHFQNLQQVPCKTVSLIFKALASLQADPVHSTTVAALIQLLPTSIQSIPQQYGVSMINQSRMGTGPSSNMGFRSTEPAFHPVLEIFNSVKRMDGSIDSYEKKYDVYISILKFAYQIVLTNEFIFDKYPNDKYVKTYYASSMNRINSTLDEGANLVFQACAGNEMWSQHALQKIKAFIQENKETNQLVLYSSFIDDLFTLIYKNILEDYDKMLFSPNLMDRKWRMGSYLLKITEVLLRRFSINLDRVCIIYENPSENCLFTHIIHHLNNSKISDFLLKTLEVVIHKDLIKNNKFGEGFNPLGIENKYWMTYILNQETTFKQIERLREMICDSLSCLETIVNLLEVYNENRNIAMNDPSLLDQSYVSKLTVVDTFEKLLTKKELLYHYSYTDMTQTIKINIILAIFSYVNFEANKGLDTRIQLEPEIEKFLSDPKLITSSIISEEEVGEIETMLINLDANLTKNIILRPRHKNNQQVCTVSEYAIRILTKLAVVWEDQIPQRKLSLFDHITTISHPDPHFTSSRIVKIIVRELLSTLVNYDSQPEDACALIELLTVCLHSQRNFVDLFLKTTSTTSSLYQQNSFLTFLKQFFSSNVEYYKPLLTKLIIFVYEVFYQEARYSSFVKAIRSENNLIRNIFGSVFRTLKPNYSLVYRIKDYTNLISPDLQPAQIKNITFQLEKLMIEGFIMQECSNLFTVVIALRFLTHELIASGGSSKQEGLNISLCIKELFSGLFMDWLEAFKQKSLNSLTQEKAFQEFLEELRDSNNLFVYGERRIKHDDSRILPEKDATYISNYGHRSLEAGRGAITISEYKKYQRKKRKQYEGVMNVENEGLFKDKNAKTDSIILRTIYKIMDANLYGFGKDYLYDTQEIYFAMKNNRYEEDFIYRGILFLTKQNLLGSLVTLENKCSNAMTTLFKFVSTLGINGQSFSSVFYKYSVIPPSIYTRPLEDIFDNDREKNLVNPNFKFSFLYGFPDFFTRVNSTDPLDKKITASAVFLEKVIRIVWDSLRHDDQDIEINLNYLKSLEMKVNFLSSAFNNLFYLLQLANSLSEIQYDPNRTSREESQMERETLPLVLEDSGLGEIIKDMFYNLSNVLWPQILEAFKALEIDISQYIIFMMTFLQCVKLTAKHINFDKREIQSYVEVLEIFSRGNISCLSLVITCFELLHGLGNEEFLFILDETQDRLLKHLLTKISLESSYEVEFIFVMKFLVELSKDYQGALHLKNVNLIWELCYNKKLKQLLNGNDYDNSQRNPYQVYWCWILILMRQMIEVLHHEPGFMNSALSFLKEFWPRINYVLTFPTQILGKGNSSKIDPTQPNQDKYSNSVKFTLAYFEELECTTSLLFELFQHSEQWTLINRPLFELALYNITHHTLQIFKPINHIVDNSTTVTPLEKIFEQILATDKTIFDKTTTFRSIPIANGVFQDPNRSNMMNIETVSYQRDRNFNPIDSYNPTVFAFKIEVALLNSLGCLLYSVKSALPLSELHNYFEVFDVMKTDPSQFILKYDLSYWDNFFLTLEELQSHLLHNFNKWMAHIHIIDKVSKKYDYLNNTVTATVQTFSLNTNFQSYSFEDFRDLTKTLLELIFYIISLHHTMFKEFKTSQHGFIEGQEISNKAKITSLLEKCATLLNNKAVFPSHWGEVVNRREKGASSTVVGVTAGTNDFFALLRDSLK